MSFCLTVASFPGEGDPGVCAEASPFRHLTDNLASVDSLQLVEKIGWSGRLLLPKSG